MLASYIDQAMERAVYDIIEDVALLQTIGDAIELAATPDEVRQVYRRQG